MLKLVSINVERSLHLDRVIPFVEREQPDVLCVQELMERDITAFIKASGARSHLFAPTCLHPAEVELALEGTSLFSRFPMRTSSVRYYKGSGNVGPMRINKEGNPIDPAADMNCALLFAEVEKERTSFVVGTTHFTWSPNGEATERQRADMHALMALLEGEREFVLCGDFNAPRGGEIFAQLAARYTDNVPPEYNTSIDGSLHRRGPLPYMVDGLFSTPAYTVSDVRLVDGVSDHMAVVATVSKS